MAKLKNKQRTGTQKPDKTLNLKNITDSFKTDTFKFVLGAAFLVIALFLVGAYISFLFNGGTDQSILSGEGQVAANSAGSLGAKAAEKLVNSWFGLPSIFIPIFLTVLGTNMMGITHFKLGKWFISCTFLMLWCSIVLHLVLLELTGIMRTSFIMPGGNHGMNATIFLNEYIGIPGIILLLLLTMLLYCVYLTRRTIEWVRNRADGLKRSLRGSDRSNADETAFTVNPIAGDETSEDMEPLQEDDNELDDEAYGAELGMSEE